MSDLIERDDVTRIVQDRLNSPYMQNKWQQGACLSILRAIEELPSARPKEGKWIEDGSGREFKVMCSNCKCKSWDYITDAQYFGYCPNCGADMTEREGE